LFQLLLDPAAAVTVSISDNGEFHIVPFAVPTCSGTHSSNINMSPCNEEGLTDLHLSERIFFSYHPSPDDGLILNLKIGTEIPDNNIRFHFFSPSFLLFGDRHRSHTAPMATTTIAINMMNSIT
jgi:hypothetical protein